MVRTVFRGNKRQDEEEDRAAKTLQTLLDDFANPEIADSLEKAFRQLGGHAEGEQLLGESLRAAKATEEEEAVRGRKIVLLRGGEGG